jgi:hypothetical protein
MIDADHGWYILASHLHAPNFPLQMVLLILSPSLSLSLSLSLSQRWGSASCSCNSHDFCWQSAISLNTEHNENLKRWSRSKEADLATAIAQTMLEKVFWKFYTTNLQQLENKGTLVQSRSHWQIAVLHVTENKMNTKASLNLWQNFITCDLKKRKEKQFFYASCFVITRFYLETSVTNASNDTLDTKESLCIAQQCSNWPPYW